MSLSIDISKLKCIGYATFIGIVMGVLIALMIKLLFFMIDLSKDLPFESFYLAPIILPLVWYLNRWLSKKEIVFQEDEIKEIYDYIELNKDEKPHYLHYVFAKIFLFFATVFVGGSVGPERQGIQLGAGMCQFFAKVFSCKGFDRRSLVVAGIAAAFSVILGAPIAAPVIAIELMAVHIVVYETLLAATIASFFAFLSAKFLHIDYHYFEPLPHFFPQYEWSLFLPVILAGLFFALLSFVIVRFFRVLSFFNVATAVHPVLKAVFVGSFIMLLGSYGLTSPLGLGVDEIESTFKATENVAWYLPLLKIVATAFTLEFGGEGGVFTPLLYVGSMSGHWFGQFIGGNAPFFAALGFVSVIAATMRIPVSSAILAAELFGVKRPILPSLPF
ncbi:chloride channel protein [Nitratiruptor sp. SB155-2]|uniref:chloride channel protein n=1 Tax=Nitratiruptor sp. (strain SB155-2) TaxID=387092 RepID=UPI0001586EA9|nr:chloride channel protein [Nitratiruptor sp. SB155-2]BAF69203.1 voltage-gated chloride channel [Nitratiruptor sp. SB155-2]